MPYQSYCRKDILESTASVINVYNYVYPRKIQLSELSDLRVAGVSQQFFRIKNDGYIFCSELSTVWAICRFSRSLVSCGYQCFLWKSRLAQNRKYKIIKKRKKSRMQLECSDVYSFLWSGIVLLGKTNTFTLQWTPIHPLSWLILSFVSTYSFTLSCVRVVLAKHLYKSEVQCWNIKCEQDK